MKRNAGIIGPQVIPSRADVSTIKMFDMHDQNINNETWPKTKKILSVSKGTSTWSQSQTYTVTVTGEGWDAGSETLYWSLSFGSDTPGAMFSLTSGSFTMLSSNTGTFSVTVRFSGTLEFTDIARTFTIKIRTGSISGPVIFETGTQTIGSFSLTLAGFNATTTNEGLSRSIQTRYFNVGSNTVSHRFYYTYLGYTAKTNAELIQGIGISGTSTQYEGRSLNKTAGSVGNLEFRVRGFAAATVFFSMNVDGDTNCVSRIYKNGALQYSVTGSGGLANSIGGCTNGDIILFEYEKPIGAASVGNDEGVLNYMYISGSSVASGVATPSSGDITGALNQGTSYTHSMGTSTFTDTISVAKDYTTEGSEVAYVQTCAFGYGSSGSGWHQVYEDSMTINDTYLTPVVSISESTTTITENDGVGVTFTVTDTAHSVADTYYYSVQGTGIVAGDFTDNTLTGSIAMSPGGGGIQGTVNKQALAENVSEGESFTFSVRTDSTAGTIRATSNSISIVDATASTLPIYLDFYESRYGTNIGTIDIYVVNASTGALISTSLYSASGNLGTPSWNNRTTSTFNAQIGTSYRWAIVHLAGSSFRGDYAVDLVRYYKNSTLQWTENWNNTNGDVGQWVYGSTAGSTSSSTTAFSNQANVALGTATGNSNWRVTSGSTGSGSTGPTGAVSGTYYAYTETSSLFNQYHWMFSPSFTV